MHIDPLFGKWLLLPILALLVLPICATVVGSRQAVTFEHITVVAQEPLSAYCAPAASPQSPFFTTTHQPRSDQAYGVPPGVFTHSNNL